MTESQHHPHMRALVAQSPHLRLPGESTYDYVEQVLTAQPGEFDPPALARLFEGFAENVVELARWRRVIVDRLAAALRAADPGAQEAAARRALAAFHAWLLAAPELCGELTVAAGQPPPAGADARARGLELFLCFLECDASEASSEERARFALERLTREPLDHLFLHLPSLIQHWRAVWEAQRHPWLRAAMIAWIGRCEDGQAFIAALSRHLAALHPIPRRATWEFLNEMAAWSPSDVPESFRASELLDRATMDTDILLEPA